MSLETVLHHKQKGGGNGANKNQQVIMNVLSTGCGSFFFEMETNFQPSAPRYRLWKWVRKDMFSTCLD
jgi:hypothetical protein